MDSPYLRVECYICGAVWNYFGEIQEFDPLRATTAVRFLGGVCPSCGSLGFISGYATDTKEVNRNSSVA